MLKNNKHLLFFLVLLGVFCSCDEEFFDDGLNCTTSLTAHLPSYSIEAKSRIVFSDDLSLFTWDDGDEIGLYYKDSPANNGAIYTIVRGGEAIGQFQNDAFQLKGNAVYQAFHPSSSQKDDKFELDYAGQVQHANNSVSHLGAFNYMYSEFETNDVGGGNIAFENVGCVMVFKIKVPQTAVYRSMKVTSLGESFLVRGLFDISTKTIEPLEYSSEMNLSMGEGIEVEAGNLLTLYLMNAPENFEGGELSVQLYTDDANFALKPVHGKNMQAGRAYVYELGERVEMNILCIGNSYSIDALAYLPPLLDNAGVKYNIGIMYIGSCSLASQLSNWISSDARYVYHENSGDGWIQRSGVNIPTSLNYHVWDVVCFHQVSSSSGTLSSITPYLGTLIDKTKDVLPNTQIAYFLTPAWGIHNSGYGQYYQNQDEMYQQIRSVGDYLRENESVDYVIPICDAIQRARNTELDKYGDDLFASSTDRHLEDGIGRLIAAYTVFDNLISRKFGVDFDVSCFLPHFNENVNVYNFPQTSPFADVTLEMALSGKQCVKAANSSNGE